MGEVAFVETWENQFNYCFWKAFLHVLGHKYHVLVITLEVLLLSERWQVKPFKSWWSTVCLLLTVISVITHGTIVWQKYGEDFI